MKIKCSGERLRLFFSLLINFIFYRGLQFSCKFDTKASRINKNGGERLERRPALHDPGTRKRIVNRLRVESLPVTICAGNFVEKCSFGFKSADHVGTFSST